MTPYLFDIIDYDIKTLIKPSIISKSKAALRTTAIADDALVNKIYEFRGQKVMLDSDLAELYGVETRRLKEQVRRNRIRFPEHFMFELTREEYNEILRSQNATSGHGTFICFRSPRPPTSRKCLRSRHEAGSFVRGSYCNLHLASCIPMARA